MSLLDRSVRDLLVAFRSSDPTPGGGSASALSGAIGASLVAMVAGLPKPRAATDTDLERLRAAGAACTAIADRLAALVDRDSEAYEAVMAAYKAPKATDDEKAARTRGIQAAMTGATETPLQVMRECAQAAQHAATVAALGNPNASSDVQVAQELLAAGLRGARANVEINLPGIKDAAYVEQVRAEVGVLERRSPCDGA
jgi:formiminotetrahydrofolate cyclodeaminase